MNKEIKEEFFNRKDVYSDGCYKYLIDGDAEDVWEWIDQKLQQQYLLGAKDLWEAVKLEKKGIEMWKSKGIEGATRYGYNDALRGIDLKAQQFIDSLKGEK